MARTRTALKAEPVTFKAVLKELKIYCGQGLAAELERIEIT
jgi:hypothetical protein